MIVIHAVIAGFTQRKNKWHGPAKLVERLIDETPHTDRVHLHRWCEDWKQIAGRYHWIGVARNQPVRVNVYGYSWGGGWGAPQLAYQLAMHDIQIPWMVLCDPVYRHKYTLGNWRAYSNMFGWDTPIKIPHNVKNLKVFYQKQNFPRAHRVVTTKTTRIHKSTELFAYHQAMDDEESWHDQCVKVAIL